MSIKRLSNNKYKITIELGYDILGNRNDNMTDFGSVIIDGCLILPTDNIPMVLNYNIPELEEIEFNSVCHYPSE